MECIKTGCLAYLDYYGEVVYGDLFQLSGKSVAEYGNDDWDSVQVLMRVCQRNVPGDASHAIISRVDMWFDEGKTSGSQSSTLIGRMSRFNYEGL